MAGAQRLCHAEGKSNTKTENVTHKDHLDDKIVLVGTLKPVVLCTKKKIKAHHDHKSLTEKIYILYIGRSFGQCLLKVAHIPKKAWTSLL